MQEEPKTRALQSDDNLLPQWEEELREEELPKPGAAPAAQQNIQDLLRSIPDRGDLERLFEKNVTIAQIVQLLGRNINRRGIQRLIESNDVQAAVRELLVSPLQGDQ